MSNTGDQSSNIRPETGQAVPDATGSALDWAREIGEADRVIRDLDVYVWRRRQRRLGLAAASIIALLAVGIVRQWRQTAPPPAVLTATNAIVLRPETLTLPDGSIVELKAGAEITVDFAGPLRRVTLRKGEAHFQVAKNSRAFVVVASGIEVRAVGTAFSVQLGERAVEVLVTEGRVSVDKPLQSAAPSLSSAPPSAAPQTLAIIDAGNCIVVDLAPASAKPPGAPVVAVPPAEVDERLSWRVPRLEFAGTPLAEAITMFNRYSRSRLVLGDPALGKNLLSGVLRADNTDSLLRLLEGEFGIKAEQRGDEIVLRK